MQLKASKKKKKKKAKARSPPRTISEQQIWKSTHCEPRSSLPAPGDEGSNTLEESLYVLEACSESFFLPLPSDDLCDFFLFFTKILYIKSIGLGRGTPDSSCVKESMVFRNTLPPKLVIIHECYHTSLTDFLILAN